MRAAIYAGTGGPEVITFRDVPAPTPGHHQVLVRVAAAGLNRADLLQRQGRYPVPPGWPADIPGLEYAGTVESAGPGASRWRPGDRVMGLVGGGAMAEWVVVHEDEALPIPPHLSDVEAAAIPEAFLTAYDALAVRGRLQAGERVLLHAVGSGVGTAAVQLARGMDATVIGTSRSAEKLERVRPLGLDVGIDTARTDFRSALAEPVHVVVDVLGGPAMADNLTVLAPRGRLVLLGFLLGTRAEVDLGIVLRNRLEIIGSVMRSRTLPERVPLVREFAERILPQFAPATPGDRPALRPVVHAALPMSELADAHRQMQDNATFGKLVLTW